MGLRRPRSFLTPLGLIDISSISGYGLGPFKEMSSVFSRVYTDPNSLLKMSALSLLPVFKIPFSLRQDTPDESLLNFFHKGPKPFWSIISVTAFYISVRFRVMKIFETYLQYASRVSF